jgi:hypothetical protein
MAIIAENNDYNLYASAATIYNQTAAADGEYELDIRIGDGTKNLNTAASTLTLLVTVGGCTVNGGVESVFKAAGVLRVALRTGRIFVASGNAITATLQSTNSASTDVDVTVTPRVVQTNSVQVNGTGQTARDLGAGVLVADKTGFSGTMLVSVGTGAGQISVSSGVVKVDVDTIKTRSVTCGAGVTVSPYVGNATAVLSVDASGRVDLGKILGNAALTRRDGVLQVDVPITSIGLTVTGDTTDPTDGEYIPMSVDATGRIVYFCPERSNWIWYDSPYWYMGPALGSFGQMSWQCTTQNSKTGTYAAYGAFTAGDATVALHVPDANVTQLGGEAQSATDLKDFADSGYDPSTHWAKADLAAIMATILTEIAAGRISASFKKFLDVETPANTLNDLAKEATAQTILSDTNELQAEFADGGRLDLILDEAAADAETARAQTALIDARLPAAPAATGDAMALTSGERATMVAAIWNALTSGFTTVGSIGKWIVDRIAGYANYTLPASSTSAANGRIEPTYLTGYQDCRLRAMIAVFDADDEAVDLGGMSLSLVAWPEGDPSTKGFELLSTGTDVSLTITGDDSNTIAIDGSADNFATAGQYDYRVYDVSDADEPVALVVGVIKIEEGRSPGA